MAVMLEFSGLIDSFAARAQAVGAQVERFLDKQSAFDRVVQLLHGEQVKAAPGSWAVWAAGPIVSPSDKQLLTHSVPGLSFDVSRERAAQARVGISEMDWALANTGTLVQTANEVEKRLVSTLPAVHIALVPTAALLPDLPAVLDRVDPRTSAYLAFITGPSRTADIERVLTIGVHGPGQLLILFIDDLGVAA